ncbi:AMP-binding protein [Mesorhizobium sp. A556]
MLVAQTLIEEPASAGRRVYRSSTPLPAGLPDIFARFAHWAAIQPDATVLSEPDAGERRSVGYGEMLLRARALKQVLANRFGLRKGDGVASLAPAGIDALTLKLACLCGGLVHTSLPPFSFGSGVRNADTKPFLDAARPKLIVAPPGHRAIEGMGALSLGELVRQSIDEPPGGVDAEATPDDWAAIFFTSGSTGAPKGVPITRGMISSNQGAVAAMWPFLAETPPVLVDWLPWHHVFGGLDNIFKVIWNGGCMHVDAAPGPTTIDASIRTLTRVGPTLHVAVPLGLRLLLDRLETDMPAALAFTRNLKAIFFAGAGIDAGLWRRLAAFRDGHGDFQILSGYGATEAASTITLSPAPLEKPGELGQPLPGHRIALVDVEGRSELRVAGPNIAPCYLIGDRRIDLPMDEAGFYRTGDAAVLEKRSDGIAVFRFDGRLAEDFKLSSGVKVRTGALRAGLMAQCAPLAADIVIAGEGCDTLVALVFPDPSHKADPDLAEKLAARIHGWNLANPGSSTAIVRFCLATTQAQRDKGELSDKGQIVQARYLRNHAELFAALRAGAGQAPSGA